ncbi:hypothetical protein C8R43DRAFT_1040722 [Mycena crocata]|nr:hypothetical protein C8R43DRAFT_1040722 [Mycena crocata]
MSSDLGWDLIQHYAEPIRRDGFLYYGNDFYVTVQGSRSRMSRTDSTRLHSLLTYTAPPPVLTKAGKVAKRQPRPHQDESEEFYLSQVAHYGLQPVKTKEAAKRALLSAFGSKKTLQVPAKILKLEEEMREEYRVANKVAKAKYLENQRQEEKKEEEKRNKRKRERDAIMENFLQETDKSDRPKKKGKTQTIKLEGNGELSGKFDVVAPFLTEQWEEQTSDMMWLKVCPSSTGSHLWGQFDFGVVSGIIRSSGALPTSVGDSMAFFWRGRESGEGESTFGEHNIGTITFLGGGRFKARMDWDMGNFDFAGNKLEGTKGKVSPKTLRECKSTWRSINPVAYGRENRARWGGWGGDEDDGEQPAGSDTTEGEVDEGEDDEREDGFVTFAL